MYDIKGICSFLKIKVPKKIKGSTGLIKIGNLFLKADRIYQKGHKCAGFINSLNMNLIFSNICDEIKPLCLELGLESNCKICKKVK